jgi:hypothetical protein
MQGVVMVRCCVYGVLRAGHRPAPTKNIECIFLQKTYFDAFA